MSVQLEMDVSSFDRLQKQMDKLRIEGGKSAFQGLAKAAMAVRAEAQLRLRGRGHIVTSRLRNSLFIKIGKNNPPVTVPDNSVSYSDDSGKAYNRDLGTVEVGSGEIAIGSNVEYAAAIELGRKAIDINSPVNIKGVGWRYIKTLPAKGGDSFLYWAMKNVNIEQMLAEKMKEDFNRFTV